MTRMDRAESGDYYEFDNESKLSLYCVLVDWILIGKLHGNGSRIGLIMTMQGMQKVGLLHPSWYSFTPRRESW